MDNKIKITFDISNFEPISEDSGNKLVGGFSASMSSNGESLESLSNNCNGGNCIKGCGDGQNVNCNTVAGCSVVKE